jgi:hypothetical protein
MTDVFNLVGEILNYPRAGLTVALGGAGVLAGAYIMRRNDDRQRISILTMLITVGLFAGAAAAWLLISPPPTESVQTESPRPSPPPAPGRPRKSLPSKPDAGATSVESNGQTGGVTAGSVGSVIQGEPK